MKKSLKVVLILLALFILGGGFYIYTSKFQNKCPDKWIKNQGLGSRSEYFIIKGERVSINEVSSEYLQWIRNYCEDRILEVE